MWLTTSNECISLLQQCYHIVKISLRHRSATEKLCKRQCDQIGRFIELWTTFQSLWQQLFCPNCPHFTAIVVKVFIFQAKSEQAIFCERERTYLTECELWCRRRRYGGGIKLAGYDFQNLEAVHFFFQGNSSSKASSSSSTNPAPTQFGPKRSNFYWIRLEVLIK